MSVTKIFVCVCNMPTRPLLLYLLKIKSLVGVDLTFLSIDLYNMEMLSARISLEKDKENMHFTPQRLCSILETISIAVRDGQWSPPGKLALLLWTNTRNTLK